ncbi:hypothetical protein GCM10025865_27770 [Paraoerskovia sediminicola]|uniref:RuvB-like AAA+ ATPase domain-containing protein n=1 Tax=Paraoerskovia sediminicola TaxID=1138587 RepID=A0ABN6XJI1_9CELL|nr:hypothetical protein GCM10025865_27770 [Paraoerskovia sediminicola]
MADFDRVGAQSDGLDEVAPRTGTAGESSETGTDRLVAAGADDLERAAEAALRPRTLDDFVGQKIVRDQLSLVLRAAIGRGATPDHVLLSGPRGSARRPSR